MFSYIFPHFGVRPLFRRHQPEKIQTFSAGVHVIHPYTIVFSLVIYIYICIYIYIYIQSQYCCYLHMCVLSHHQGLHFDCFYIVYTYMCVYIEVFIHFDCYYIADFLETKFLTKFLLVTDFSQTKFFLVGGFSETKFFQSSISNAINLWGPNSDQRFLVAKGNDNQKIDILLPIFFLSQKVKILVMCKALLHKILMNRKLMIDQVS